MQQKVDSWTVYFATEDRVRYVERRAVDYAAEGRFLDSLFCIRR